MCKVYHLECQKCMRALEEQDESVGGMSHSILISTQGGCMYISMLSTIRWDHGENLSFPVQSAENHRKECHRFWLRLRHAVILISNVQISASKKI